ncbi:LINE-1 retrotransposable element ORF2 protein [Chionoecetes opilio]|uniref:LINE-1 retrotransposable element ORF2 protein n=1 Tax=Chionoecetes opilio TaxID=41210 RepID=A0A8J4YYG5_CHIOP|nr:LINE-1 retrotransposable element ORF2 protein [Chionoecetes opilio]
MGVLNLLSLLQKDPQRLQQYEAQQEAGGLETAVLGLTFLSSRQHFAGGVMRLKCVARISHAYFQSQETTVTLATDRLPHTLAEGHHHFLLGGGERTGGGPNMVLLGLALTLAPLKTLIYSAAKECIGERPRSRRGFVSTETLEKIEESRAARLAGNRDQHRALSRRTRTLLRRDKEKYVRSLAEDVEGHLNANDLRPAYRALKKLRSKSPSRASAIRTADGRLVSDMDGQMARWAEYFGQLFTVDPPTEQLHTTGLQAVDADPPIDETAPSLDEVREAVAKLRGGKAAGVCNISAELLKAGGEAMIRGLHAVLTAVWQSGTIPPDWKRGLVVPIWKGKGDRQDCNNYRGITLLNVPGKVLVHLLLTRIRSHLVKHQRPQQSGFTPGKSTTDRILVLRVLVERRREFRQGMLAAYVDLKKAFDSVHRESLWDLLRLRGIPARTIGLITGLYSGTESAVKCGAGVSSFFPVNTGVRQGCVLAPSLFNACMDWVLDKVVDQSDCGASVGNTKITDLVFADDAVIFAESLEVLVMALEALHEEAKPLGLEVSWLKTKFQVFGDLLDEAVHTQFTISDSETILTLSVGMSRKIYFCMLERLLDEGTLAARMS